MLRRSTSERSPILVSGRRRTVESLMTVPISIRPWYKFHGWAEYLNSKPEVEVRINYSHRDDLVKIAFRLNFTTYLVLMAFLLSFLVCLRAAPQGSTSASASGEAQRERLKVDLTHRTE